MQAIDVDRLTRAVSEDCPCGDDAEYEREFMELERLARGRPTRHVGDVEVPAELPDWHEVMTRAQALLDRTKDIRVLHHLACAALRRDGLAAFARVLAALRRLLELHWDALHPRVEDGDPTLRVTSLAAFADRATTLRHVAEIPLFLTRAGDGVSLRDVQRTAPGGTPPLGEVDPAQRDGVLAAAEDAAREILALGALVDARLDHQGPDLSPLRDLLAAIPRLLGAPPMAVSAQATIAAPAAGSTQTPVRSEIPAVRALALDGRADVSRVLHAVCAWFASHEPSSPVPLLLQRAIRVHEAKDFLGVIADLAPNAMSELRGAFGEAPRP